MDLRFRQMRSNDVSGCVRIVSSNPILGERYGSAIAQLEQAWVRLLGSEAFTAVVFEEWRGDSPRLLGSGVSAFVSDDFVRELKSPPLFWIGPELARRSCRGVSSLLSDKQFREANTRGGLNLVGWHGAFSKADAERVEVLNFMFSTFVEVHRGYLVKELIGQADSAEMVNAIRNTGGCFFDADRGLFVDSIAGSAEEVVRKPHLVGSTRVLALTKPGLWGTSLFAYQPPRFGFRRSEQKLLLAALRGQTDEDLANDLALSLSAVRRLWLSIYDRVGANLPQLFGEDLRENHQVAGRGKGKKYRLLAYIHEHPEELRPVARRLLPGSASGADVTSKKDLVGQGPPRGLRPE
jgi:hypothetical protein